MCVLFLRLGSVPGDPGRALGAVGHSALLRRIAVMASNTLETSRDWLRSPRTRALAWWLPQSALIVSLFFAVSLRCARTHCRYTGPYYFAMIAPVLALGSGMLDAGSLGWLVLAVIILAGSKLLWWATERAWGKFS